MTMVSVVASLTTFALILISDVFYVRAILRRETQPSRSAFWVWTFVQIMTVASFGYSGGSLGVTLNLSYVFTFLLFAILSVKYGEGTWNGLDTTCLVLAIASGAAWYVTRSSEIAVYLLLLADAVGAVPVLVKSWHTPEHEDRTAWTLTSVASVTNVLAIEGFQFHNLTAVHLVYAAYYVGINTLIALVVRFRPRSMHNASVI